MRLTGRSETKIQMVQQYLREQGLYREYDGSQEDPEFSGAVLELDLSTVTACISGPKRPHDKVAVSNMKQDWASCLKNPAGFKGFGLSQEQIQATYNLAYKGQNYTLRQGSVVIAAITSCTNTSNPGVIMAAGILARNAVLKGLKMRPYIKTSLSPGSGVVEKYILNSGLNKYFDELGFNLAGFGCMTCIGNSGELDPEVSECITSNDLVATAVLSGNRNFEARVH
jgi:aconitate hydratase